jgi:hypothetical protein
MEGPKPNKEDGIANSLSESVINQFEFVATLGRYEWHLLPKDIMHGSLFQKKY